MLTGDQGWDRRSPARTAAEKSRDRRLLVAAVMVVLGFVVGGGAVVFYLGLRALPHLLG